MDTWLPYGRMPQKGNHLASPGRLAGRLSSLHDGISITKKCLFHKPELFIPTLFNAL